MAELEPFAAADDGSALEATAIVDAGPAIEPASRRPEPELVAVPMQPEQELVYGWLGLNPALLLDPVPATDNLVVRVVRPGQDPEAVLEEARQQLAAAGPRRRRRGRGGSGSPSEQSAHPTTAQPTPERLPLSVDITPLPAEPSNTQPFADDATIEVVATVTPTPAPSRNGRSRSRRSEAADAPAAVRATVTDVAAAPTPAEPDVDDSGEPRRRRRRSSAAG